MFRFIISSLLLFSSLAATEVAQKLKRIPIKDRERIERLFSYFVKREGLGFVLLSTTKPACMISLPLTHKTYVLPFKAENPFQFQKELGLDWQIWERYQHLFSHPNIIVCEEYNRINGGLYLQLFFLNKKQVKLLLENYRDDFVKIIGNNFDSDKFIRRVEKTKKLRPLIYHDEKLLGLLLGFGLESSLSFKNLILGKIPDSSLGGIAKRPKGCCITPVSFRGNPDSPEVKKLVTAYTKEILQIEKVYKSESFLRSIFEQYCAP